LEKFDGDYYVDISRFWKGLKENMKVSHRETRL